MVVYSSVSEKTHVRVFSESFFLLCVLWLNDSLHPTAKMSEQTNRNMSASARNMLVQLLAMCTNPEGHNAQRHRQTEGRTTDKDRIINANSRSYCVAEGSAKNHATFI